MKKKEFLIYLHGYLKSLKSNKNWHKNDFKYINRIIAKHSEDKLIEAHRNFKDIYDEEMMDIYYRIQEKEFSEGFSINRDGNFASNSKDDLYNPDSDLDQQNPDFYV